MRRFGGELRTNCCIALASGPAPAADNPLMSPSALEFSSHHGLSGIRLGLVADFDWPKSAGRGGMT